MRRLKLALTAMAVGAATLSLAACSSTSADADWKTPKDVIDALKSSGFTCTKDGAPETDTDPKSKGVSVSCDEFVVVTTPNRQAMMDSFKETCADLSESTWPQGKSEKIVDGTTFLVFSSLPDAKWPGTAQPEDFVKAFGGDVTTFTDLFAPFCDVDPATVSAAPASATADTKSDINAAAVAMETAYTNKGSFPTTASELGSVETQPGTSITVVVTDDGTGYQIYGCSADSPTGLVYDSMAGGLQSKDYPVSDCPAISGKAVAPVFGSAPWTK